MYIIVHNQMSQNAARTNSADTPKAGMIAGPPTASQTAQPAYQKVTKTVTAGGPQGRGVLGLRLRYRVAKKRPVDSSSKLTVASNKFKGIAP